MSSESRISMLWRGAANYLLSYRGVTILIDPLFTRLPGDKPHLAETKYSVETIDYLLLTHGHLDHSWDVPYLAAKHQPEIYGPHACLADVERERPWGRPAFDSSKWHTLESMKGTSFSIADIEVTPHQIGTEAIDWWFLRGMVVRPLRHRRPSALGAGISWLRHHVFGNCFAFEFQLRSLGKSMLYFGNLTGDVTELDHVDRVDVLAIPYCPANRRWLQETRDLINRFTPAVTLVHHFDNFMNPFTLSKYMNLDEYRRAVRRECPDARLFFSKFGREVDFASIAEARD